MSEEEKKTIESLNEILFKNAKEILLNLIEKLLQELQQKDEIIKTSIIPSYEETIAEHEKQLFEMQEELQLKDKVIKEQVKYIESIIYVDKEECEFENDFKVKCREDGNCKECIKQYFINKVKGE